MHSFKTVNQQFGNRIGDIVFGKIYEYLHDLNPKHQIFRCYGDVFGVIRINETMDEAALSGVAKDFPVLWTVGDSSVGTKVKMACINSAHCVDEAAIFFTLDYIMEEFHQPESPSILLADHDFYNRCLEKSQIEHILAEAIANDSIQVYYQPIHRNLHAVESLEALLRIYDPKMGFVPPEVLIGIAEQNGSVIKLGEQVLHKVCRFMQACDIQTWGISSISINLSVVQCMQQNSSAQFLAIVRQYGIDPHRICFEITESTSVDSFEMVRGTMSALAQRGFHLSLDDFGTGYANFRYLLELPFTNVKIDKSLLWAAINQPKQEKLLSGMVGIIRSMGFRVICEGVETQEQVALLRGMGVELHQGFYYAKALPEAELVGYLGSL